MIRHYHPKVDMLADLLSLRSLKMFKGVVRAMSKNEISLRDSLQFHRCFFLMMFSLTIFNTSNT